MSTILDSGSRTDFSTGAVRDIQEGKGRCDLLPLDVVTELITDQDLSHIMGRLSRFMESGDESCISYAVICFMRRYPDEDTAILELATHFEDGCKKYGPRNWEKGIPLSRYMDSGIRHLLKCFRGDEDERHDRAFMWNMVCLLWTMRHVPEMNDLPFAGGKEKR